MIAFLVIIISYFSTTTFCSHIHIIDGELIIHSHIFVEGNNDDGTDTGSKHQHTQNEIQIIQILSVFHSTDNVVQIIEIGRPLSKVYNLEIPVEITESKQYTPRSYYLRPPPVI